MYAFGSHNVSYNVTRYEVLITRYKLTLSITTTEMIANLIIKGLKAIYMRLAIAESHDIN